MSSVLASFAQVPARVGYFKTDVDAEEGAPNSKIIFEVANFTAATGYVKTTGNIIYFDTYANATSALVTNGSAPVGTSLANGELYRDMGKTFHIYVGLQRVATITKVQRNTTLGETTEGPTGSSTLTPAAQINNYLTGYVVTWSANQASIPAAVVRTGY
jgi:hypothetical protein